MKNLFAWFLIFTMLLPSAAVGVEEDDTPRLLQNAQWIWAQEEWNNQWVDFACTFNLSEQPQNAYAEIGVENTYHLYVNGTQVVYDGGLKRGPNPTDGYFDKVNLTPYLSDGENVLCVKAWFWGVKSEDAQSYSNVPVDSAGLIFAADIDGSLLVTDESWKAKVDEAYRDDTVLGVPQPNLRFPEYNIYYNAAAQTDAGWLDTGYDFSAWPQAKMQGQYGDAPWNALHARPIPPIKEYGLRDYENSADYAGYTTDAETDVVMYLPYNAQFAPYLEINTEWEAVITITTENTLSCESVYTTYAASPSGHQAFESPAWISGQFVTYHIPVGVTIERLAYRESGYDTEMAGNFSMGDAFFDTLWQMGARTQYLCIRENFMDCPDRERAQWTGDATSQMRQMMYCLDPAVYPLYVKMLNQKAAWITPGNGKGKLDNLIPTVTPIFNEFYELPAQEMAGIIGVWDYYLYTGDEAALRVMYEPAIKYLQRWKLASNGLVKHKTGHGLVDWQDTGLQVDTKVSENAWYYWCLQTLIKMAKVLGEDDQWQQETAAKVAEGYESLWVDGLGYSTTDQPDDRGNALAVLSGLAPEERNGTILNVLKSTEKASSYMETYVLEAMFKIGANEEALDRMQRRFGNMVAVNLEKGYSTLWEYFEEGMGTWNHAWSASAVYLLPAYVGGIRPTSPGYNTCVIAPDFSHSDWVSVQVETVKGLISVSGTAEALEITLPDGVAATVVFPSGEIKEVTQSGSFHAQE